MYHFFTGVAITGAWMAMLIVFGVYPFAALVIAAVTAAAVVVPFTGK